MLKAIKNRNGVKPRSRFRGWKYPIEGYRYVFIDEYNTLNDLYNHVRKFEAANNLEPLVNLYDTLEDYFCRTCSYYGQFCAEMDDTVTVKDRVRRVISGGKAIAKMKIRAAKETLKVLPPDEVQKNVDVCVGCDLNRYANEVGHEAMYVHDIEKAYGVEKIEQVHTEKHSELGRCQGCGCKVKTKVFLHEENYGEALVENPHDINRLLKARTGNGEVCWQLERVLLPEHLQEALDKGRVTFQDLKRWGYK